MDNPEIREYRLAELIGDEGHYALLKLEIKKLENLQSIVKDECSWEYLLKADPHYNIGKGYHDWKQSAIEGLELILQRQKDGPSYEIKILDLNGHPLHSKNITFLALGVKTGMEIFGNKVDPINFNPRTLLGSQELHIKIDIC